METEDLPVITSGTQNDGPSIVSFGGGHGLYAALRAFRLLTEDLTAVVTVADDGGIVRSPPRRARGTAARRSADGAGRAVR